MNYQDAYNQLFATLCAAKIIDTHEHLPPESQRLKRNPDFSLMFSHYCQCDLIAAGMSRGDFSAFIAEETPIEKKWQLFVAYYDSVRDASTFRAAHLACEKFYGISELTSQRNAEALTVAIREANKPGLYRRVLNDACGIRLVVNYGSLDDDPQFFAPVIFVTQLADVTKAQIRQLEGKHGFDCNRLDRYLDALAAEVKEMKERGAKGLKFHFAYMRTLKFASCTHAEAERVYNRVLDEGYGWRAVSLGYEESRPLQDYLVHRLIEMAGEHHLAVVFHTGYQAHIEHNFDDCRPGHLWNLCHRFPRVNFVVLHAGQPWMEDAALLARNYPNAYLDMGWVHLTSPTVATRGIQLWVDLVPRNKVLGFGGDYLVVEKVYGHLVLARENIARGLAVKVAEGALTVERAEGWIQAMMTDNPIRVFQLEENLAKIASEPTA